MSYRKNSLSRCIRLLYLLFLMPVSVLASEISHQEWANWFTHQILISPEVVAARENMNAQIFRAEALAKPRYNPELLMELENEGDDDNYSFGIGQTIDVWNKRKFRRKQSASNELFAKEYYNHVIEEVSANSLHSIIQWKSAKQIADMTREQQIIFRSLLTFIKERQEIGDLGVIDAELALLSFSQNLNETASALENLAEAQARVKYFLPGWNPKWSSVPDSLFKTACVEDFDQCLDEQPEVKAAKAHWQSLKQVSTLMLKEKKPDPDIGIYAGKAGQENVAGVTISFPVSVRNNYSAEAKAAISDEKAAEARYLSLRRHQKLSIKASVQTLDAYREQYDLWRDLIQGRSNTQKLLEGQWQNSDLSTSDYVLTQQQRMDGEVAGIELRQKLIASKIKLLMQTGELFSVLTQMKQNNIEE